MRVWVTLILQQNSYMHTEGITLQFVFLVECPFFTYASFVSRAIIPSYNVWMRIGVMMLKKSAPPNSSGRVTVTEDL